MIKLHGNCSAKKFILSFGGLTKSGKEEKGRVEQESTSFFRHADYDPDSPDNNNDIALIKIPKPIQYTGRILMRFSRDH